MDLHDMYSMYNKDMKDVRKRLAEDSEFRDFIVSGAMLAHEAGFNPRLTAIALAVVMQDYSNYLEHASTHKEDTLAQRMAQHREMAAVRRHMGANGKDIFVLEVKGNVVIGTGGCTLPSAIVHRLENDGIQVPVEFR